MSLVSNVLNDNSSTPLKMSVFQRWMVFAAMMLADFSLGYSTFATTNAMIAIRDQMNLNSAQLQWTMNAYILPAASLTVLMGMLSDRFGKRNLVVITLILYLVGCLLTALSTSALVFILGRLFQGIGAACLMPVSLAILKAVFPSTNSDIAPTSWSVATAVAMLLGPFSSGLIVSSIGWPYVYWISFIISALSLILLLIAMHKYIPTNKKVTFDFRGMLVFVIGIVVFVYAFVEGGETGWGSAEIVTLLCLGVLLLLAQPLIEHYVVRSQFINYRYFLRRHFTMGCITFFIVGYVLFGFVFFFNVVLQDPILLHLSPTNAGYALLPLGICFAIASLLGTRIIARLGRVYSYCAIMLLFLAGYVWLAVCGAESSYNYYWEPLVLIGLAAGTGIKFGAHLALLDFPPSQESRASGIAGYHMYIGAIFGTSLGVVFYLLAAPNLVAELARRYHIHNIATKTLQNALLGHPGAIQAITRLSAHKPAVIELIRQASINGVLYMTLGAIVLSVLGLICALLLIGSDPNFSGFSFKKEKVVRS